MIIFLLLLALLLPILLLASVLAYLGYIRIDSILGPPIPLPAYVFWALKLLALISPTCIAVAWLRCTGVQWATALKLLPIVPVGAFTIWLIRQVPLMMG